MKTFIRLISAPWAAPFTPSLQLGALKAWLDAHPVPDVEVSTHSAFADIPLALVARPELRGLGFSQPFGEHTYALLLLEHADLAQAGTTRAALLRRLNAALLPTGTSRLDLRTLRAIEAETLTWTRGLPSPAGALSIYGFTLNYDQVTASLFIARELLARARRAGRDVLFLFGGMSAADPASVALIRRAGLPAFGVLGEGELKLEAIARACAAARTAAEARAALAAVRGVYDFATPPDLWVKDKAMYESQLTDLRALPIPDFSEYFASLDRRYRSAREREAAWQAVDLPIEGSRGCFAKCTFCGLNYLWQGFRKLPADTVADRVARYQTRYPLRRLKFVDNVCDTWAESWADAMLARNARVESFMELRAHHPEAFWTKLSLAGLKTAQIGIEALSVNVMRLIQKGTNVAQNLLVQKTLCELGVESTSNLITHYPGSTPEDVDETRRVLELISHLPPFTLARFALAMGSPLFEKLSVEERHALAPRGSRHYPPALASWGLEFGYEAPPQLLSPESRRAWDDFVRWHRRHTERQKTRTPRLRCETLSDGRLRVVDTREGRAVFREFSAEVAGVYLHCHAGPKRAELAELTQRPQEELEPLLAELIDARLLLEVQGRLLALATRARDELLTNLARSGAKPRVVRASAPLAMSSTRPASPPSPALAADLLEPDETLRHRSTV